MNTTNQDIREKKKALLWQCRRGIKEIEVLLIPFLEQYYESESEVVRTQFEQLLSCEDLDIFEWFMHRVPPEDQNMEEIVNVILSRLAS